MCRPLLFFSPSHYSTASVAAACGRRGEPPLFTRLSGRARAGMLLDRGADLSSPGFMHPQTRNQRCKAQTFCYLSPSSVQSAAAESNLVSAMPRFMVSQPRLRCWLPVGRRKPGLSHRSRMRGPWHVVTLEPRSDAQAGKWPRAVITLGGTASPLLHLIGWRQEDQCLRELKQLRFPSRSSPLRVGMAEAKPGGRQREEIQASQQNP